MDFAQIANGGKNILLLGAFNSVIALLIVMLKKIFLYIDYYLLFFFIYHKLIPYLLSVLGLKTNRT